MNDFETRIWAWRASGIPTDPGREGGKDENKPQGAMIPGDGNQSLVGGGGRRGMSVGRIMQTQGGGPGPVQRAFKKAG